MNWSIDDTAGRPVNQPQKFLFETSFDASADAPAAESNQSPAAKHSDADLERARAEGLAAGREAGQREALQSLEHASNQALDGIGAQLRALIEASAEAREAQHRLSIEVAHRIVRTLFPRMMEKHGSAEIDAIIGDCLDHLREEPRVVVRVADRLLDTVKDRVTALAARVGYEGRLVFLAEDSLGPGDVRVEWADGGAERHGEWLWREIDAAVDRALNRSPAAAEAATSDPTTDHAPRSAATA